MKFALNICLAVVVWICTSPAILACSCGDRQIATTAFRGAQAVFVGTVKEVNKSDSNLHESGYNLHDLRTTFYVDEALKSAKAEEVDVYTSSQGTACGINFEAGEKYLVYAYGGKDDKKYYGTGICTRTRFAKEREDEIAVLRSISKGKFEPRIYGSVEEIVRSIFLGDRKQNVPMAGIKIVARNGGIRYESVSDENGKFSFVNVASGTYRLQLILPPTHKLGEDTWGDWKGKPEDRTFRVTNTDCPDSITLAARVDGRIKGRLFDFRGAPVGEKVRVTLVTKSTVNNSTDALEYIGVYTDKSGFYEFYGIPEGSYYLGVNLDMIRPYKDNPFSKTFFPGVADSANATTITLGLGQKLDGFNITLPKPLDSMIVRGKVLDRNGQPAAGVTVYVSNQVRHDFQDFVWLKTDENGEFSTSCLVGLKYRFMISVKDSRGYNQTVDEKIVEINSDTNFELHFKLGI